MNTTTSSFENIIDRITDAFVALDVNWCYTYVNKKAGQIFDREPQQLIGKHIWTEFPEGVGKPFQKAYEKAMKEQIYIYLEEYYEPYNLWFENHIYPSPDGLSIVFRDVTDRKKMEERLIATENQFRTVIVNAPVATYQTNEHGQITYVNERWMTYTGMQLEEAIGGGWENAIHTEDKERVYVEWANAVKNEAEFSSEFRYVDRKGNVTWASSNAVKLLNDEGKFIGHIGMALDITEHKKAERLLSESEEKFRMLADRSIQGIMMRLQNKITYVNPAYCQISGYSEAVLMGQDLDQHLNLIHPDDQKKVNERLETFNKIGTIDDAIEFRFLKKNGELVWVKWMTKNVVLKGITYQMSLALDITDQKIQNKALIKSNQRNAAFLEVMPDVIFVITKDGVFADYNNPLGFQTLTPPETFLQKSVFEILPPDIADKTMHNLNMVFEKGESPTHQYQLAYPEGNQHFEARYAKINDNEVLVIVRNITDSKIGEEKIKQLNEELESRVKERTAALEIANENLQEINDLFVGNEITVFELKEEIRKLKDIQNDQ